MCACVVLRDGGATPGELDPATRPVCQVAQVLEPDGGSCKGGTQPGWCYVADDVAGDPCAQSIVLASGKLPAGSKISLECIEPSLAGDGG